tara:strand:+ start:655 stop:1194 length:540 start_codon:yes stop_codon:yes gene_type:complete
MFNKSYTYILPILSTQIDVVKANLINTFVGSDEYTGYNNHIFLLYKYTGNPRFIEYEDYLENTKIFVAKYDPDRHHVMFVFEVPKKYQDIYNKFLKGKYSEFSEDYKLLIFEFHKITDPNHKVAKVLYRHPDIREELEERLNTILPENSEVSSIPDLNIEIYTDEMKVVELLPPEEPFK